MCIAYQTQYMQCGCSGPLMIDDCLLVDEGEPCPEREAIERTGVATKIKKVNALCPDHQ